MGFNDDMEPIPLILLVSGMTKRSLLTIKIIHEILDKYMMSKQLKVYDVYLESSPDGCSLFPVVPILIGNLPEKLINQIKEQAKQNQFYLPILKSRFIQFDEWRGNNHANGFNRKGKNS